MTIFWCVFAFVSADGFARLSAINITFALVQAVDCFLDMVSHIGCDHVVVLYGFLHRAFSEFDNKTMSDIANNLTIFLGFGFGFLRHTVTIAA